jgi:hypothetical protein
LKVALVVKVAPKEVQVAKEARVAMAAPVVKEVQVAKVVPTEARVAMAVQALKAALTVDCSKVVALLLAGEVAAKMRNCHTPFQRFARIRGDNPQ